MHASSCGNVAVSDFSKFWLFRYISECKIKLIIAARFALSYLYINDYNDSNPYAYDHDTNLLYVPIKVQGVYEVQF